MQFHHRVITMAKQKIQEKLAAIKEKFQQKKKLFLILIAVVIIVIALLIVLGLLSGGEEENKNLSAPVTLGTPAVSQPSDQGKAETQQESLQGELLDTEVKPLEIPEGASQQQLEVMAEDLMLELEKLQQQQEDVVDKMDEVEQKLKKSMDIIKQKQAEIEQLKSQQK